MERGGNNQGERVMELIRANGGTGPEPWCGDFVAWCYRTAGSRAVTRSWAAVRLLGTLGGMRVLPKRAGQPGGSGERCPAQQAQHRIRPAGRQAGRQAPFKL